VLYDAHCKRLLGIFLLALIVSLCHYFYFAIALFEN